MTASETALVQRLIDDLTDARATAAAAMERLNWLQAAVPDDARPSAPVLRLARHPATSEPVGNARRNDHPVRARR